MRFFLLATLGLGSAAYGQAVPAPSQGDPRVATVHLGPNEDIEVETAPGRILDILFEPEEQIESVSVGDRSAYQVIVPSAANALLVHALRPAPSTKLAVRTDLRAYLFILTSVAPGPLPQVLYVRSVARNSASRQPPIATVEALQPTFSEPGEYKVGGSKSLRPSAMRDDGLRTYIQWGASQPIPAVFALDDKDREEMVNGFMRDGYFTIDRVHRRLLFRIDKAKATATRRAVKAKSK